MMMANSSTTPKMADSASALPKASKPHMAPITDSGKISTDSSPSPMLR